MRPGWIQAAGLFLAILAASCSSPGANPPPELPKPQVHLTPAAATRTAISVRSTRTTAPTREAAREGSLTELARAVYGDRLIAQIQIARIHVNAPVVPVGWQADDVTGDQLEWESPDASVGWAVSSSLPDQDGNIILYGHNNLHSNVFMHLDQLEAGDAVDLRTGKGIYTYRVDSVEIIPVTDPMAEAEAVRQYFQTGGEPRLTILSCWPPTSNTHRVIVIARPEKTVP